MRILTCECLITTEGPGSDLVFKGDDYVVPACESILVQDTSLVVIIRASLSSGVRFIKGSAELVAGDINLYCDTQTGVSVGFEMVAWQLNYRIQFDIPVEIIRVNFQDHIFSGQANHSSDHRS